MVLWGADVVIFEDLVREKGFLPTSWRVWVCVRVQAPAMLALGADYAGVDTLVPRIAKG